MKRPEGRVRLVLRPMICVWPECEEKHKRARLRWAVTSFLMDGEFLGESRFKNEDLAREGLKKKARWWRKQGYEVRTRG